MNLSRLATLAVFFMMVLSAFVTVPTYNVGADEEGCMDYDDENENGAYDEGEPCHDDDDGDDNPPGEGEGCMDYDDENDNGAYDEGEPCYDDECPFDPDNSDSPCNANECEDHESQECADYVDNYCANNDDSYCSSLTSEECPFDDREGSPCEDVDTNPCREDHDSPDCHEYAESYCANNDDPGCYALMADYVCYNMETHNVERDYRTEDECVNAGYMWVSSDGGPDNGDNNIFGNLDFTIVMESLSEWHVFGTGQSRIEDANYIRDDISEMCLSMGTVSVDGMIDEECFNHWVMMIESDDRGDDRGDDGPIYYCSNDGEEYAEGMGGILCPESSDVVPMCPNDEPCKCIDIDNSCTDGDDDWGYYPDEFRCPPDFSETECIEFEACQNTMSMSCMRLFYDYCKDNPMCEDDENQFVYVDNAGSSEWNGQYHRVEDECGFRGDGCRNNFQKLGTDRHLFTNEQGYWFLDQVHVGTAYRALAEDGVMIPPEEGWEVHPDSDALSPSPTVYWYDDECYDDDGNLEPCGPNIWHVLFAYEDGDLTAAEFLESDEMVEWFDAMNEVPTPEEAMDETDADGDGFISFGEFETMWSEEEDADDLDWEAVEDLFNEADTDGDGLLELDELQFFIDGIVEMTDDVHDHYEHTCHDDEGNEVPAHGDNEDRCHYYENPGIYSTHTFTADQDSTVQIYSAFESHESPEFVCGDESTISFQYVNDDNGDCDDGADEQWYDSNTPDDMTDDCQEWNSDDCVGEEVNWFDCHDGSEIWINQVNNWEWDCEDGEDEYQEEYHSWNGRIYLLQGSHNWIDGSDLTSDEVYARETSHCDWGDDEKTYTECAVFLEAYLKENEDYTLVTMGECMKHYEWQHLDCKNYGTYNHKVIAEDGTESNIDGEILNAPKGFEIYEIIDDEWVYNQRNAANFTLGEGGGSNFVLYNKETFVVDEDGFSGTLVSFAYNCYVSDEDGQYTYCGGETPLLYLYDAFDETDPESGLIGSAVSSYHDEWDCRDYLDHYNLDEIDCSTSEMDLDLSEGDYTIVTAFGSDAMFTNRIFSDGETVKEWGSHLHNAYYDYNEEGEETLVTGNDRIHMPYAKYKEWKPECYDEDDNVVDCEEMFNPMYLMFDIIENMTGYGNGTISAEDAAENLKDLMYTLFERISMFEDDNGGGDNYDDGDTFGCYNEYTGYWDDGIGQDGCESYIWTDTDGEFYCYNEYTGYWDDGIGKDGCESYIWMSHDDGDALTYWETWNYCEWEGDDWKDDTMWYCTDNANGNDGFEDWWYYCENHEDDGWRCTDDFGQSEDYEHSAEGNEWSGSGNDGPDGYGGTWLRDSRDTGRNVACTENIVRTDVTACTQWRSNYGYEEIVDFEVLRNHEGKQELSSVWVVSDQGEDEEGEYFLDGDWYIKEGSGAIMWRDDINPNNDGDDHGDNRHDENDNPPLLDGIVGVQYPEEVNCMPESTNVVGSISANEDLAIFCSFDFKVKYEGVDDTIMEHVAIIPFDEGEPWTLEFVMLEGYEVISCKSNYAETAQDYVDNCDVGTDGKMTGTGPIKILFGKTVEEEPQPDCDHVIGLDSTGFAFDKMDLTIDVGDTVCWQWTDAADAHNVLELEISFDPDLMTITEEPPGNYVITYEGVDGTVTTGFSSGVPSNTVDFRHTFTTDDKTHYYVCVPHASMPMGGRIVVGDGSEDDSVEEVLEEGLPSVSFIVGSLVLVGAAGLRRRIH